MDSRILHTGIEGVATGYLTEASLHHLRYDVKRASSSNARVLLPWKAGPPYKYCG